MDTGNPGEKIRIAYEFDATLPFVAIVHREGRFPVARASVTQYGEIELTGADGVVEVLGAPELPCHVELLKRLRTHHEGLLFVEFKDMPRAGDVSAGLAPAPVCEQMLTARLV
jgi:hypothetical protein